MGSTPKKTSKTGQTVIQRMELEGKILRDKFRGSIQVLSEKDNEWYPLEKCDMSHKDACVTYWNGRRKQRKRRRRTEVDNAINSNLAPLFLQLPVENIVYTHQQDYYNTINKSTEEAQCGSFIEFMLEKILETLKSHQGGKLSQTNIALTERQQKILELLNENVATNVALNSNNLAEKLGVSRKTIERDMTVLQEKGLVQRVGSNKTGHWELVNTENTW